MIIPIKCFTCGSVLADKYRFYLEKSKERKLQKATKGGSVSGVDTVVYLTRENMKKTEEAIVLDELGLMNVCCRRHMLTHVDIE